MLIASKLFCAGNLLRSPCAKMQVCVRSIDLTPLRCFTVMTWTHFTLVNTLYNFHKISSSPVIGYRSILLFSEAVLKRLNRHKISKIFPRFSGKTVLIVYFLTPYIRRIGKCGRADVLQMQTKLVQMITHLLLEKKLLIIRKSAGIGGDQSGTSVHKSNDTFLFRHN